MIDGKSVDAEDRMAALAGEEREAQLDPVRKLILRRSREMRLTLADLSRATSKNAAYFHQFMWTNRPRRLPEEVREVIADHLGLPADMLRHDRPHITRGHLPLVLRQAAADEVTKSESAAIRQSPPVPVYRDSDEIVPERTLDWLPRPTGFAPPGPLFGLWITRPAGRMQVGDLALVTEGQPPRPGDSVVVLRERRVAAIGTLQALAAERAVIAAGQADEADVDLTGARVLKVVALVLG